MNAHRGPLPDEVINYVTSLALQNRTLVGGDFNLWRDMFELGLANKHRGRDVSDWSIVNGMDYIGVSGAAAQISDHVLDLTFSNIPFASTGILHNLNCESDQETQVTIILGRGIEPLEQTS